MELKEFLIDAIASLLPNADIRVIRFIYYLLT